MVTEIVFPTGISHDTTVRTPAGESQATSIASPSGPVAVTDATVASAFEVEEGSAKYARLRKRAAETATHFDGSPRRAHPFGRTGADDTS